MDNSMSSMTKTTLQENTEHGSDIDPHEESSSWTFYFENFLCNNNDHDDHEHNSSVSSGCENPSLVSDAASSVAKKLVDNRPVVAANSLDKSSKSLSFKRRKIKGALVDVGDDHHPDLEDTASSPVDSPKVCFLKQLDMNREVKDNLDISEGKGNTCGQTDEGSELGIVRSESDHTDLKKRGLCLVPVSTLANYLG